MFRRSRVDTPQPGSLPSAAPPALGVKAALAASALAAAVLLGWAGLSGASAATVAVTTSASFGPILTTPQGLALYTLSTDQGGIAGCTGACAQAWPPLTVPAGTTPTGASGVSGTLAAALQPDGAYQVTYNGSPLYTFAGDAPGQVTGNGVAGFSVVEVAAVPTTTTTTSAPVTSTTTTSHPAGGGQTQTSATPTTTAASASPVSEASSSGTTAPTSLAVTGAGGSLLWMAAVGMALLTLGMASLATLRGRRRAGLR